VTADLRLAESSNLAADESALTGESLSVEKGTASVAADSLIADRSSMVFKGTAITRGSAVGIVVATGLHSELGQISQLVEEAAPDHSPLERQLQKLGGQLIWFTLAIVFALGIVGVLQGEDVLLMVEASIALAVAAIPEGLPVVATMALARGMWRMARHNALIERLSAVETLGATTVIFTDKTGTLTENSLQLQEIDCPEALYRFNEDTDRFERAGNESRDKGHACLHEILTAGVLCNNAELSAHDGKHTGDPLEQALLTGAGAEGLERSSLIERFPRVREIAFDSTSKLMATVHKSDTGIDMWVKGAPEAVLDACTSLNGSEGGSNAMTPESMAIWRTRTNDMAARGMRVLAVAKRRLASADAAGYSDLTFLGLLGLYDPPRADVPDAIAQCRSAGIRVIMMTGDHAVTARNIATSVGLADHDPIVIGGRSLRPIDEMSEAETAALRKADVFARVSPAQKLALISVYQNDGHIVAMTGDGVNDAPALKQADIGVAMGLRGTQVAREAAAMVLRDDAFASIVSAIREGRVIFRNIQKFVTYLLSCNLSEILVVGAAILSGLPLPLLPLQILFLNLVTDVFPAFALGASEGSDKILHRPPRDPRKPIVTRQLWIAIVLHSLTISAATLAAFLVAQTSLGMTPDEAVTVSFLTLALAQLWHVFNMRDP
ncbi:cation-translocating P-type ATPase, partial [Puniceibacterium confluentis]|uniref:cation-translocating P-type ATPase n=1 Tax=Puniceibacterium confluentis TaxID=1958944 RepID=UPI003567039F